MKLLFSAKILNILIQIWPKMTIPFSKLREKLKNFAKVSRFVNFFTLEGTVLVKSFESIVILTCSYQLLFV